MTHSKDIQKLTKLAKSAIKDSFTPRQSWDLVSFNNVSCGWTMIFKCKKEKMKVSSPDDMLSCLEKGIKPYMWSKNSLGVRSIDRLQRTMPPPEPGDVNIVVRMNRK